MNSSYEQGKKDALKQARDDIQYDNAKTGIPDPEPDAELASAVEDKVNAEIKQHVEENYGQD